MVPSRRDTGPCCCAVRPWQPVRSRPGCPQDYVRAHMWFNLATAQGLEQAREARDLLARHRMTPDQIANAQRLARQWLERLNSQPESC